MKSVKSELFLYYTTANEVGERLNRSRSVSQVVSQSLVGQLVFARFIYIHNVLSLCRHFSWDGNDMCHLHEV